MTARRFLLVALCVCVSGALLPASASGAGYFFYTDKVDVQAPDPANVQMTSQCTPGLPTPCVVYDWDWRDFATDTPGPQVNSCEGLMFPDMPVHAFYDKQNRVQMLMGVAASAHRLMGPELDSVVPEQQAASLYGYDDARPCSSNRVHERQTPPSCPEGQTCPPYPCEATNIRCRASSFRNAEWLDSVWTEDGEKIHTLLHNEHHGDHWQGQCDFTVPDGCYYSSITYARSTNMGADYTHASPDELSHLDLVAQAPYQYEKNKGHVGFAAPTNIHKSGSAWVTIAIVRGSPDQNFNDPFYFKEQRSGACALRTLNIDDPSSWEAWSGTGFTRTLENPYTFEPFYTFSPRADHVCQPLVGYGDFMSREPGLIFTPRSLVFHKPEGKWILVGVCGKRDGTGGFCYSYSESLTGFWSDTFPIMGGISNTCPSDTRAQYPSIIDPTPPDPVTTSAGRNFETIDDGFVNLYFKRLNAPASHGCPPKGDADLVRAKIRFKTPFPPPFPPQG